MYVYMIPSHNSAGTNQKKELESQPAACTIRISPCPFRAKKGWTKPSSTAPVADGLFWFIISQYLPVHLYEL